MGGLGSGRRGGWAQEGGSVAIHRRERASSGGPPTLRLAGYFAVDEGRRKNCFIGMHAERDQLHLDYCVRIGGGEWEDVVETVRLVHVPCRYGGERRYFLCPGQPGGAACGRRAGKLYASGRYFLCRHCFKLTYSSQCEDAGMRLRRKARKAPLGWRHL